MGFFKKLQFWRKKEKRGDYKKRVEELEKKIEELQEDMLEKKDREREEVEVTLQGRIRELEEQIAAKGGEMDTVQEVPLEEAVPGNIDNTPQEDKL